MFHRLHTLNVKRIKYSFDRSLEVFSVSFKNEWNRAVSSKTIKLDKLIRRYLMTFGTLCSDVKPRSFPLLLYTADLDFNRFGGETSLKMLPKILSRVPKLPWCHR